MDFPVTDAAGKTRDVRNVWTGLDALLPDLLLWLPRCDAEITMRKALAETCQLFCRETGAFTATSANITLAADVTRYAIPVAWAADILTVTAVRVYVVAADGTETLYSELSPIEYAIDDPADGDSAYITLGSAMSAPEGSTMALKVDMSLIPYFDEQTGVSAEALPEKFVRRWRGAFVAGTLARLAGMDGKAWTNKSLADANLRAYRTLHGEAVSKANISQMRKGGMTCRNPLPWC